jgi:Tol biopolymer transport system component
MVQSTFFKKKSLMVAIVVSLFLVSCRATSVGSDETDVHVEQPSGEVIMAEEPTPLVIETVEPPEPAHKASGLIFTNADGTWWINRQGELQLLIDKEHASLSPDRQLIAYLEEDPTTYMGDIWLLDISTSERVNITNTPDRDEGFPAWIPGQNDMFVFGSDTQIGMTNAMYPTLVGIDGSGYEILDPEIGGFRGISPSGEIVYGGYEGTMLVKPIETGATLFNPTDYGLSVEKLFLPAWSPDGKQVAWFVTGDFEDSGRNQLAIAVFDLEAMTAITLHAYEPIGGSMFINDLAWSPDGEWLAFTTFGEPPATGRAPNLWVIRPNGLDQAYIGEGSAPIWRYDSQYLAYQGLNDSQTEELYLASADSWVVTRIDDISLPERISFLLDWVVP